MRLKYYAEVLPGKLYLWYCHLEDFYLQRKKRREILNSLSDMKNPDEEQKQIIYSIRRYGLNTFHGKWARKYDYYLSPYGYDEEKDLPYIIYPTSSGKKRIYLKRGKRKRLCQTYGQSILMEQDEKSPHRYLNERIIKHIESIDNSVIIDIGVAEGNFALDVIEKVGKLYLFEAEREWNNSLQATFAEHREKIEIINNYVTDHTENEEVCLDDYFTWNKMPTNVSIIKMDIEGAEQSAIRGMRKLLELNPQAILLICLYHSQEAETEIKEILDDLKYEYTIRPGYMTPWMIGEQKIPYMRRGVLEAHKKS